MESQLNLSGPNTDVQTYPYEWDFTSTSSAWSTSQTQLRDTYDDWSQIGDNASYYTQNHNYGSYPIGYNIDVIKGLRFSRNWFGLDWSYGHIWFSGGSIVIPNLSVGQIITFVMEGRDGSENTTLTAPNTTGDTYSILNSNDSHKSYRYSVTANGDVTFTFNHAVSIKSISVVNKLWAYTPDEATKITTEDDIVISGEAREFYTQGNVSFTTSGSLVAGTEITDMPGITMTIGASEDNNWAVGDGDSRYHYSTIVSQSNSSLTLVGIVPTNGTFYKFTPSVNGFLTLYGTFLAGNTTATEGRLINVDSENNATTIYSFRSNVTAEGGLSLNTTPLIAGNTYYFYTQYAKAQLRGFTFRPAFLTPDETAEQSKTDAFNAYASTISPDEYPKLVHGNVGVSFSGDVDKVNLANDGTLTLVGPGTTYIRGKAISGANELCAYYKLTSKVLSLVSTNPTNGSTITSLNNSVFQFLFDQDIALLDGAKFVVLKNATDITSQCAIAVNTNENETDYQKRLNVSGFGTLLAGSTYTIRLLAGAVSKSGDADIKNAEVIGTFTVESTEPPLTWLYPLTKTAVKIGSSIVLTTTQKIDETSPTTTVIGTLTYDGDNNSDDAFPMTIKAIKDDKNLVFKPTSPMLPNKLYTLTVGANQVKWNGVSNKITVDKIYMFTTGTATGDTPILSSSFPADGSKIDLPASNTKVDLYFDQNVDLEPYSSVTIWPVNGGENLSTGTSDKLVSGELTAQNMTVDVENPKHVSFEIGSDIKYDLWYQLQIPANTVTGPGGMPNNAKTVLFKINRNSNSHEVTASSFYPHTWDFNKFGKEDNSEGATSSIEIIKANTNSSIDYRNNADQPIINATNAFVYSALDGGNDYLCNAKSGYGFDQGNDIYIATSTTDKYFLPEFEGIRVSTKNPGQSKRFAIRDMGTTNDDGSEKFIFRLNGNTHYMTLSNVPAGKLYMVVNTPHLGINSPNAVFESVSGSGYELSNNNEELSGYTLLNTHGTKKVVINVTPQNGEEYEDVSFCVQNFNCEKIGVAEDEKTFNANFAESGKTYATDRLTYDVRYDLLNAFTDHDVKAYYVSSIADNPSDNTGTITATEVPLTVAKSNQGVMVLYQSALGSNTTVPIFKTDVNSAASDINETDNKNKLKVISVGSTSLPSISDDYYMYVLSNRGTKTSGISFYRYTGSTFSDRAAYLEVPKTWVEPASGGASRIIRLVFEDENGSKTTMIRTIEAEGVSENIGQNGDYYDSQGQRIAKPSKPGLYIKDGKKMYVK